MYLLIGILGSLAIQDLTCKHTIVDCYLNNWQVLFVEISYLFGRITVFPCVLSISRTRLLEQFYGEVNPKKVKIFNIIFISIATMFSFLSPYLPIDLVMNLVGSIVCYFFIYAIPTKMHYECLFGKVARDSLIESIESIEMTEDPQQPVLACPHAPYDGRKHIKIWTFVFYIVLNVIGIAIGIYGVYSFFAGFFQ